ncbi:MAG: plasmid mobilization protein [Thermoguttaceae bacterium]
MITQAITPKSSVAFTCRLSPEEYEILVEKAQQASLSRAELIRKMIVECTLEPACNLENDSFQRTVAELDRRLALRDY